nr:MAG TPA: hypothetical protein [Caudoviricetes sp.]
MGRSGFSAISCFNSSELLVKFNGVSFDILLSIYNKTSLLFFKNVDF